jgi:hypothetical protein
LNGEVRLDSFRLWALGERGKGEMLEGGDNFDYFAAVSAKRIENFNSN